MPPAATRLSTSLKKARLWVSLPEAIRDGWDHAAGFLGVIRYKLKFKRPAGG